MYWSTSARWPGMFRAMYFLPYAQMTRSLPSSGRWRSLRCRRQRLHDQRLRQLPVRLFEPHQHDAQLLLGEVQHRALRAIEPHHQAPHDRT